VANTGVATTAGVATAMAAGAAATGAAATLTELARVVTTGLARASGAATVMVGTNGVRIRAKPKPETTGQACAGAAPAAARKRTDRTDTKLFISSTSLLLGQQPLTQDGHVRVGNDFGWIGACGRRHAAALGGIPDPLGAEVRRETARRIEHHH